MPPIVEWSLRMISVLLDGIDSNDGPGNRHSSAKHTGRGQCMTLLAATPI